MQMRILLVAIAAAMLVGALHASAASSPRPVACTKGEVKALVSRFTDAFKRGDRRALDSVIAREPRFRWYSTDAPGQRLHAAAADRAALGGYFARRHAKGESLHLFDLRVGSNTRAPEGPYGNFSMKFVRSALDLPSTPYTGKGSAYCYRDRPDTIFVWSMARDNQRGAMLPPATGGTVRPNPAKPTDAVWVVLLVPYLIDNNGDGYRLTVRGPGGVDCASTATYGGGSSWNARYNHRHREAPDAFGLAPSRGGQRTPFAPPTTWCVGHYEGKLVFSDYPRGERKGSHNSLSCSRRQVDAGLCKPRERLVKRVAFDVR